MVVRAMTERERKLFFIFKRAIEAEQNAQRMYSEALGLCEDPSLKAILQGFHDDEVRHEREVMARYDEFRREFAPDAPAPAKK